MKETEKREKDLVVGYSDIGPDGVIYDPLILRLALAGAVVGGFLLGLIGFMVATGKWALVDLGQFSAVFPETAMITAAGVGVAFGGLAGGLTGLYKVLRKKPLKTDSL